MFDLEMTPVFPDAAFSHHDDLIAAAQSGRRDRPLLQRRMNLIRRHLWFR